MVYLRNSRIGASYKPPKLKKILRIVIILAILGSLFVGLLYGVLFLYKRISSSTAFNLEPKLVELWKQSNYQEILAISETFLKEQPLDPVALVFDGLASFYLATSRMTEEDKATYLDRSIVSLRRALLLNSLPNRSQVDYVLGKAYFQKGSYYHDVAIFHLESAMQRGISANDIFEYLGLSYMTLGRYADGIEYFEKAIAIRPSDVLLLSLAQGLLQSGNIAGAKARLTESLGSAIDPTLEQKARFLLADIFMKENDLQSAEQQYIKILEKSPNSADAHFFLGEIYATQGDTVKARSEWRKTLKSEPNHYGALKRLYG